MPGQFTGPGLRQETRNIMTDVIHPLPRQLQFLEAMSKYRYLLYGGAAGGGKSHILRTGLVYWLWRLFRDLDMTDVRVGLFCETYRDLLDRQISKVETEWEPWLGIYYPTRNEFIMPPELGGGIISFRNLDSPDKYRSVEFAAIAVDELTLNPKESFDLLRSRLRWPGIEFYPFIAATNPMGPGLAWVKKLWIDRDFSGDDSRLNPDDFYFVKSLPTDNPHLPKAYFDNLDTLPPMLRKALLEGDWGTFQGQMFPEFKAELHVVTPWEIPEYWERVLTIDWGYSEQSKFAVLWFALDPAGGVVVYREVWQTGLIDVAQASLVLNLSQGEVINTRVADPSVFNKDHNTGVSVADTWRSKGLVVQPASNARVPGWQRVRHFLQGRRSDGVPFLRVFNNCSNLVRTFGTAVIDTGRDPVNPTTSGMDMRKGPEDHALDALRYGLMSVRGEGGLVVKRTGGGWKAL